MADKLYRSHSLEYSKENTSGSLTVWEDYPVSPFEVGDTFSPVQGGPQLTVEKVSIKDNVVGELYGKPVRQWEITIEGSDEEASTGDSQTHIKYNFNISADEKSGTMEVTNTGDNPTITLDIGDSFSVPGVGLVKCSNVKGSDDYDDEGIHSWTVVYEGSDKEESSSSLPETKYSFSIEKSNDIVIHSGSMQVVLEGDNPSFTLQPGTEFTLPGLGKVTCTKISGSDEHDDNGLHTWTITYEGSDEEEQQAQEALPEIKYNFTIEKNGDIDIHTGSMTVVNEGDRPSLSIATGEEFIIPGVGNVTCTKVSGNDEFTENGTHLWTVTYEGTDAPDDDEETLPEVKYNFTIEGENEDNLVHSGTVQVVNTGETPAFDFGIGREITVPGIGKVICTKINGNDEFTENGTHLWTVTYEGTDAEAIQDEEALPEIKYSFSIDGNSDSPEHSGSMQVVNEGDNPALTLEVGSEFTIPGAGKVICTKVSGNDEYTENGTRRWTVTYEGTTKDETAENIKYSFSAEKSGDNVIHSGSKQVVVYGENPTFVHAVGGKFIIPGAGEVTCTKYNGSDEYTDSDLHKWTITYEGTDAPIDDEEETLPEAKYNFSVEGNNDDVAITTGSKVVVTSGDTPPSLSVGGTISVPGAGTLRCTKVSGSDEYTENGTHLWTVTYEGTNAPADDETLPEVTYSFSLDKDTSLDEENASTFSGSKKIVSYGETPNINIGIGAIFNIPGIGDVRCTKVTGNDDFTDTGIHRWTVIFEGEKIKDNEASSDEDSTVYSFNIEKSGYDFETNTTLTVCKGTKKVITYGETPDFINSVGSHFSVPGIGEVTCINVSGADEYTDDGQHKWIITYEGSNEKDEQEESSLPEPKYSLAIQKDNDGEIQSSGSMSVVKEGDNPAINISVGSTFHIPGLGSVKCTKVSANDDYTDTGIHRWNITYEGITDNEEEQGDDEQPDTQDANNKYSFSIEQDSSGNVTHSGSVEITSAGNSPSFAHTVGANITLPGIGEVKCTKISGSDSYTDAGKRKWTVVYEGADNSQSGTTDTKYTLNIENNSEGVTVYSGSKEISCTGQSPTVNISIGDKFTLPLVGKLTCTRIHSSNESAEVWSVVIEGSRYGDEDGEEGDSSLPETETAVTYEINGTTTRTVEGEFVALRRSTTPITKKTITVYTETAEAVAVPGSAYEGGIVTSENVIKETIKSNGVVTGSYYKHTIETEA